VEDGGLVLENRVSSCGTFGLQMINPTSYAHNIISLTDLGAGSGGAVGGGLNGGGNVCDIGRCPGERRRFYLTLGMFQGNHGTNVCSAGFHFASLPEILDPTGLEYDRALGVTALDSGGGPPLATAGWVRSGEAPGGDNCSSGGSVWSSNVAGPDGAAVRFQNDWAASAPHGAISPWEFLDSADCSGTLRAWCVED
jgi:hypothetical protein